MITKYNDKDGKLIFENDGDNPHLGASFLDKKGIRYQVNKIELVGKEFVASCDIIKNFDDDNIRA